MQMDQFSCFRFLVTIAAVCLNIIACILCKLQRKKNLVKNRKLKLVMIVIAPVVVVNQFSGFGIEKETEKVREREVNVVFF